MKTPVVLCLCIGIPLFACPLADEPIMDLLPDPEQELLCMAHVLYMRNPAEVDLVCNAMFGVGYVEWMQKIIYYFYGLYEVNWDGQDENDARDFNVNDGLFIDCDDISGWVGGPPGR